MSRPIGSEAWWSVALADATSGASCQMHGLGSPAHLPVDSWHGEADLSDRALLDHCPDLTLDVGCGPGRMAHELMLTGRRSLGIDVAAEAVRRALSRGVAAVRRDVFDAVPGEGRWACALLADGNIGIGGDPVRLLRRLHDILGPQGHVVADLAVPGTGVRCGTVHLRRDGLRSTSFDWSQVGPESIPAVAGDAGFASAWVHHHLGRWFAVLRKAEC